MSSPSPGPARPAPARRSAHRRPRRAVAIVLTLCVVVVACGVRGRALPTINAAASGARTKIYASDGTLITELAGEERRDSVPLDEIPRVLQNAVVSIEDERFWEHNGIDPKGVLRA